MLAKTIAHYEILDEIGAGGMGVVYRARDTRLKRKVAIKALPEEFAKDAERLARFEREARLLASLNNSYIATIHGLEEVEDRRFLVMELVEGKTLAERLAKGPLPVQEALELARQIAEALEAAHEADVIHRDVKPGNIMIGKDDKAKVLDFGLAKALRPEVQEADPSLSPTLTQPMTQAGQILGTPVYMSPEQVKGKEAGKQSDIWAFGCVFYEMLTGERTFSRPTGSDTLAAILEGEPDWERLPESTPALARSVLRRCLEKDPKRRLHDVADARIELEEAMGEPALGPQSQLLEAVVRSALLKGVIWTLASVALAGSLGVAGWLWTRPEPVPPPIRRFDLDPPPGVLMSGSSAPATLAVSPDGEWVAFRGNRPEDPSAPPQLYLRAIKEVQAQSVPGTEYAWNPFFSPDSRWLGFHSRGAIRKVPLAGGEPLLICEAPDLRGASWGEDNTILFSSGEGLLRISAEGGEPAVVTTPEAGDWELTHYWPHHLPGGRAALFLVHRGIGEANHEIAVLSLETGEQRTLLRGGTYPRYADGNLVFSRLGTLYAAPFDLEQRELTGEPQPVLDDVYFYRGSYFVAYDLARTGALVFNPGAPRVRDARLVQVDRQGRLLPLVERRAPYVDRPVPSPDGQRLAVLVASGLEEMDLWAYEPARNLWERLTSDGAFKDLAPVWTPDGASIIYSAARKGAMKVFRVAADGSGAPEQLTTGPKWDYPTSISPDGRTLLILRMREPGQWYLMALDLSGDPAPPSFLGTQVSYWGGGEFSPDGRWIAYAVWDGSAREIYARPYPGPGPKVRISTEGGSFPHWSPDGDEIFYRCEETICAAPVKLGPRLSAGPPRRLFELDFLKAREANFTVSPDGQRIFMVRYASEDTAPVRIVYVPNWTEELKQTVSAPAG